MKKSIFPAMLLLTCILLCMPFAAYAESPETAPSEVIREQTEEAIEEENRPQQSRPQPPRSTLNFSSLTLTQTYTNPNPRRQISLQTASAHGCYIYQWYSSNPEIVAVDNRGVVTALDTGSATIFAYTTQGETLYCLVQVKSDIGKVTLKESIILAMPEIGSQQTLHAFVAVQNPEVVKLMWTSSNPEVAIVDQSGVVTAVSDGVADIKVCTPEGKEAGCTIYVGTATESYDKLQEIKRVAIVGGVVVLVSIVLVMSMIK